MSKATGKQRLASLFARISLVVLFLLNFIAFTGVFLITLFPNFHVSEFGNKFQEFSMWSFIESNTVITNWGIVILSLISFVFLMNIIIISLIKKSSYTIGKRNKLLKYFSPMIVTILILMIISLINKPGLIQIDGTNNISFLYKKGITTIENIEFFKANSPFNIAWLIIFIIFTIAALGFVIDFIIFILRVLFSRTFSKHENIYN